MQYQNAKLVFSCGLISQLPRCDHPEIAFAGRSNVGKSSLLNRLFGRKKLARVSSVPGKTATVNFYLAKDIYFVDLPGYGYAKVSKEEQKRYRQLMNGYFAGARDWLLIILLLDIRHLPSDFDQKMIAFFIEAELPFLVLLTKADKLSEQKQRQQMDLFQRQLPCGEDIYMLPVSSVTGQGIDELKGILEDLLNEECEGMKEDEKEDRS